MQKGPDRFGSKFQEILILLPNLNLSKRPYPSHTLSRSAGLGQGCSRGMEEGGQEGKGQQQQGSRAGRQREGEQAATGHWSSWPGLRWEREGGQQTRSQLGLGDLQPEPVVKISVFYL